MNTVVVLPVTTTVRPSPVSIILPAGQPLPNESSVLAFQPVTIDQQRLERQAGVLTSSQLAALDKAIKLAFGLT